MKKIVFLTSLVLLLGTPTFAGDVTKRSYSRYFEWESTDCYKPDAPYIFELDEFNRWEAENYIDEVENYINCVNDEASTDYDAALRKLADGIEEGRDDAISEVKRELDTFISSL